MVKRGSVEKDIPVGSGREGTYAALKALKAGESVLVETDNPNSLRASVRYLEERYSIDLTVRKQAPGAYRVWRVA